MITQDEHTARHSQAGACVFPAGSGGAGGLFLCRSPPRRGQPVDDATLDGLRMRAELSDMRQQPDAAALAALISEAMRQMELEE